MSNVKKKFKKHKTSFSAASKMKTEDDDELNDADDVDAEFRLKKKVFQKNYGYDLQDKLTDPNFDQYTNVLLKKMEGKEFTVKYCQETGFCHPILFEDSDGLGLKMPSEKFSVKSVEKLLGADRILDVMEVGTQKGLQMTLKKFVNYYVKPLNKRKQLFNVLSLEFSNTKLEKFVQGPKIIKELDWVELAWPKDLRQSQTDGTNSMCTMKYPKVQNYCLMSVGGCYTDFHVDFGGTSVWYHILKGEKVFWLAPPTDENLQRYKEWTLTGQQQKVFLGDIVEKCIRIRLKAGNTFMIPSGWIHAVYTPVDSLVFGGNFLHSFALPIQLRVYQLEIATRVPKKFRYPFFQEMQWYLAERYFYAFTGVSYRKKQIIPPASLSLSDPSNSSQDLPTKLELSAESMECKNDEKTSIKEENKQQPSPPTVVDDFPPLYSPQNLQKLTKFEVDGLKFLAKWLNSGDNKRHAPDRIRDPDLLLLNLNETLNSAKPVDDNALLPEGRTIINAAKKSDVKHELFDVKTVIKRQKVIDDGSSGDGCSLKKKTIPPSMATTLSASVSSSAPFTSSLPLFTRPSLPPKKPSIISTPRRAIAAPPSVSTCSVADSQMTTTNNTLRPSIFSTADCQIMSNDIPSTSSSSGIVNLPSMSIFQRSSNQQQHQHPVALQQQQFTRCVLPLTYNYDQHVQVSQTAGRFFGQQKLDLVSGSPVPSTSSNVRYLGTIQQQPNNNNNNAAYQINSNSISRPTVLQQQRPLMSTSSCINFNSRMRSYSSNSSVQVQQQQQPVTFVCQSLPTQDLNGVQQQHQVVSSGQQQQFASGYYAQYKGLTVTADMPATSSVTQQQTANVLLLPTKRANDNGGGDVVYQQIFSAHYPVASTQYRVQQTSYQQYPSRQQHSVIIPTSIALLANNSRTANNVYPPAPPRLENFGVQKSVYSSASTTPAFAISNNNFNNNTTVAFPVQMNSVILTPSVSRMSSSNPNESSSMLALNEMMGRQ